MPRFSRDSRLTKKQEFDFVFAKPRKVTTPALQIFYRQNQQGNARLGFVIPKHAVSLAVDRNRIRRVIRESFRQCQAQLDSLDIIVMARKASVALENQDLRAEIEKLWQSINR